MGLMEQKIKSKCFVTGARNVLSSRNSADRMPIILWPFGTSISIAKKVALCPALKSTSHRFWLQRSTGAQPATQKLLQTR